MNKIERYHYDGSGQPVPNNTLVKCWYEDCDQIKTETDISQKFSWGIGNGGNILYYQVVEPNDSNSKALACFTKSTVDKLSACLTRARSKYHLPYDVWEVKLIDDLLEKLK